jgi:hypothetical protein
MAFAAVHIIIACSTTDCVVSRATIERVMATATQHGVIAATANQAVRTIRSNDFRHFESLT